MRETDDGKLEGWIKKKSDEPAQRVDDFEARNGINSINQNAMRVIRFYSGPVKFTLTRLDRLDRTIGQHLTSQWVPMTNGMATSRLDMSPDNMGIWLKSSVAVYLIELTRLLQYKWDPSSVRNGSG